MESTAEMDGGKKEEMKKGWRERRNGNKEENIRDTLKREERRGEGSK